MYYIVQNNTFSEPNYHKLIKSLERLNLKYEIVKVLPFTDKITIKTKRKDIFPFGALKLAKISNSLNWYPGSQMNENHNFMVYKKHYKQNLLNYDSQIIKFNDKTFFSKERFFARPTKDTKVFTGKEFDFGEWSDMVNHAISERRKAIELGYVFEFEEDAQVQISSIKKIQQEIRFWIVKGKIITASTYRLFSRLCFQEYQEYLNKDGWKFCQKMVDKYQLNDAFVMDLAKVDGKFKIIECGCINCAGFYAGDIQKILIALEDNFNNDSTHQILSTLDEDSYLNY